MNSWEGRIAPVRISLGACCPASMKWKEMKCSVECDGNSVKRNMLWKRIFKRLFKLLQHSWGSQLIVLTWGDFWGEILSFCLQGSWIGPGSDRRKAVLTKLFHTASASVQFFVRFCGHFSTVKDNASYLTHWRRNTALPMLFGNYAKIRSFCTFWFPMPSGVSVRPLFHHLSRSLWLLIFAVSGSLSHYSIRSGNLLRFVLMIFLLSEYLVVAGLQCN